MQTHAANLYEQCARRGPTRLIALRKQSKIHVLWFFPFAVGSVLVRLFRDPVEHVLCADAVSLMILLPVLWVRRTRVSVVVYGLDLLVRNPLYQRWLRRALRRADRVVAISDATAQVARERGADPARTVIHRPGVVVPDDRPGAADARAALNERLGLDSSAFVVLTLGRLVRRKGVRWFVAEVLPKLPGNVVYVVAGSGPEDGPIRRAVAAAGLVRRTRLLGGVDAELRELLLRGADVFVMPNVPVPGDMEGFGLVAVEAAMRGTPVVAARIEGIVDAVVDGETGFQCEPLNSGEFAETIGTLAAHGDGRAALVVTAARVARERFSTRRMDEEFDAAFSAPSSARAVQ